MEPDNTLIKNLNECIIKLNKLKEKSELNEELNKEILESSLVNNIVNYFDIILSNNFIKVKNDNSDEINNYYNSFIIKHFNTPLIRFFIVYNESLSSFNNSSINNSSEKNWILLSLLENSFSDCINEIYKQNLDKKYYSENALLRKYKNDIKKILKELKYIEFNHIKNPYFDKYMKFLEEQSISSANEYYAVNTESQISGGGYIFSTFSDMSILKKFDVKKKEEENVEDYDLQILKDFSNNISNNFYTFIPEQKENSKKKSNTKLLLNNKLLKINNESNNINIISNNIESSQVEDDANSNSNESNSDSEEDPNIQTGLILNPVHYRHLPTDNLYQVKNKPLTREYNEKDELIYDKKLTPMTNSFLLYLNSFYKKALYHKFYKNNLHHNHISLKSQNFQCFICLKKFNTFLYKIPLEPIFWCSYYMRFVCKDCIAKEYSIIPYFILANWSFEKFSVSKNAKLILEKWYDKPVIYFKKDEGLIKAISSLNQVVQIKKTINYIFDKLKCEKKKEFIEKTLGEYQYLALKEIIFSIRDLVEINNKIFFKKINEFLNEFIKHISGDCEKCKYEGSNCKCGSDEKLFFYDYKNVFYCPLCDICYHKKCRGILGYMCGHE